MNIGDIYWEMIIYMEDYTIFLDYVGKNYEAIQGKLKIICGRNKQPYNQDYLQESIIRCHNAIQKKGFLRDKTPYGIESYLIRAYFNLDREDKRAAHNKKRDNNYDSENINELYETYYNENNTSAVDKIKHDFEKDFSILYIMSMIEEHFSQEDFYLFRLKTLCGMTYKQVAEKTNLKGVRTRILEIKKWLQENVKKDEVKDKFYEAYKDLL